MIYLPSLIWQPFSRCEQNCPDCYVRASRFTEEPRLFPHLRLMSYISGGKTFSVGELVVSVDKVREFLPSEKTTLLQLLQLHLVGPVERTQLAVRDCSTVKQILQFSPHYRIEDMETISISNIRVEDIDLIKSWKDKNSKLKINWNLLADKSNVQSLEGLYPSWIGKEVDSIHVIYKKAPLGSSQSYYKNRARFIVLLEGILKIKALRQKTFPDRCNYISLGNFKEMKYLCKKQVHIWPDGSATCCPYDSNGVVHDQPGGVIENIKNALMSPSPLTKCRLRCRDA